jgi:uncharacterized protein DUF4953/uncharacterized protein DUF5117
MMSEPDKRSVSAGSRFDEIVREAEKLEGLFTLYRVRRNLFAELRPEQLDTTFLFLVSRGTGLGERNLYFGDPVKDALVLFHRVDDEVQLIQPNTRVRAPTGSPTEHSVRQSFADSLLASFKVEAVHPERKSLLINLSSYLLTDVAGTARALNQPGQPGGFSLDVGKSYWGKVRAFSHHLELDAVGVVTSEDPYSLKSVSDSRGFLLTTHYSLAQLPSSDYRPRLPDPRLGLNLHWYRDYAHLERGSRFTRYVCRWNLQKQNPAAKLSPPRLPIVFYLENNIPLEYRQAVREGLLMWNRAFEPIGIQDAIQVLEQPEDPAWNGNDFGTNSVRWVTSTDASYGIGFARHHPLTGEVLKANITLHADCFVHRAVQFDEMVDLLSETRAAGPADDPRAACALAGRASAQLAVGEAALELLDAPQPEKRNYIHQAIRWTVAHELGHVLGLGHNYRGSTMLPLKELHHTAVTQTQGLSASIMDYLPPNLAPLGQPQGDYFPGTLGPYDYLAIEYLYRPIDAATPEQELPALRRIAERTSTPGLAFGGEDDDGLAPTAADPLGGVWDLSSDPIAWADQRLQLCRDLLRRLETRVPRVGESYTEVRRQFDHILTAYLETLQPVARYVGGIYLSHPFQGDPGAGLPLEPVSLAEQRRALAVIRRCLFDTNAFRFSPQLLRKLASDPYAWAGKEFEERVSGTPYHPLREQVLGAQKAMLARLTHPVLLARLVHSELLVARSTETLTLAELLGWLTHTIWSEVEGAGPKKPIAAMRRDLQREHLTTMIGLILQPAPGLPEEARALAWSELTTLHADLEAAQRSPAAAADPHTRAHLAEAAARLARALDARASLPVR